MTLISWVIPGIPLAFPRVRSLRFSSGQRIGEAFEGEELVYDIGFWWFKKAATGSISLRKDGDGYIATLTAETLGIIGLITRYRKDTYLAHMEEVEDGRRFRTWLFEKTVTIGDKVAKGYTWLDYENRVMRWKSWKTGREEKEGEEAIPPGLIYDDPLSAFYNFRFGAYGPVEEKMEYHITTFPKKGVSTIYARVASSDEKALRLNPDMEGIDYLVDVVIDKELFGQQSGNIEVLFSKELIPIGGTVKDIIFFGDVEGRLVEISSRIGLRNAL